MGGDAAHTDQQHRANTQVSSGQLGHTTAVTRQDHRASAPREFLVLGARIYTFSLVVFRFRGTLTVRVSRAAPSESKRETRMRSAITQPLSCIGCAVPFTGHSNRHFGAANCRLRAYEQLDERENWLTNEDTRGKGQAFTAPAVAYNKRVSTARYDFGSAG